MRPDVHSDGGVQASSLVKVASTSWHRLLAAFFDSPAAAGPASPRARHTTTAGSFKRLIIRLLSSKSVIHGSDERKLARRWV
jgi:hypothetical protein